ncbi:aminopeptidase O [Tupaia chinensis]|uniref:aminopeptidase O n=1 Tax=Tupaia chinensis TaxID=246437 RepID=UPI000FFB84ED|nr:aminopeptidase O [Tupaia chinensis]
MLFHRKSHWKNKLMSPHIIFLSQSTLTGSSHLCGTRLCHEIAHAWFGLAIGARDWTEEWLSEGFATHLEDVFWAQAQQLAPHEAQEQQELRAHLRWYRLRDETRNSPEEMQVLRPSKEKTGHVSDSGASVIKHGLNPEKTFMQVHYLKGYFLLRFLARRLGEEAYFSFLRKFVHTFHGQLILSQDFLQMLLEDIPEGKRLELSVENIFQDWLESSGIPKFPRLLEPLGLPRLPCHSNAKPSESLGPSSASVAAYSVDKDLCCKLTKPAVKTTRSSASVAAYSVDKDLCCKLTKPAVKTTRIPVHRQLKSFVTRESRSAGEAFIPQSVVFELQVMKWLQANRRPRKRKRRENEEVFEKLLPDQLILLLECLLEQKTLNARTLQSLQRTYQLHDQDAEVRHRWCELIIKHKYARAYKDVERFLQEDQAMGIYLYGELMVSEDARQQQLARKCFELAKEQMDRASAEVVAEMLF